LDGGATINDGAGGVITHEAKANALAAYQNKLVLTTGHGTRSFKGLPAMHGPGSTRDFGECVEGVLVFALGGCRGERERCWDSFTCVAMAHATKSVF
jgi:hypothetical protein